MGIKLQLTPKVKTRETAFGLSIKFCSNQGWARYIVPVPGTAHQLWKAPEKEEHLKWNVLEISEHWTVGKKRLNGNDESALLHSTLCSSFFSPSLLDFGTKQSPWDPSHADHVLLAKTLFPSPCETMWDLVSQSFSLWDKYEGISMSHNLSLSEEAILNEERTTEDERR